MNSKERVEGMPGKKSPPAKAPTSKRPPTKPPTLKLEVEDAETLNHFLKIATKVYNERHPEKITPRGRPSLFVKIFSTIEKIDQEGNLGSNPTQYKVIQELRNELPESEFKDDVLRKYAKAWILLVKKSPGEKTEKDLSWISKKLVRVAKKIIEMNNFMSKHNIDVPQGFMNSSRNQVPKLSLTFPNEKIAQTFLKKLHEFRRMFPAT